MEMVSGGKTIAAMREVVSQIGRLSDGGRLMCCDEFIEFAEPFRHECKMFFVADILWENVSEKFVLIYEKNVVIVVELHNLYVVKIYVLIIIFS